MSPFNIPTYDKRKEYVVKKRFEFKKITHRKRIFPLPWWCQSDWSLPELPKTFSCWGVVGHQRWISSSFLLGWRLVRASNNQALSFQFQTFGPRGTKNFPSCPARPLLYLKRLLCPTRSELYFHLQTVKLSIFLLTNSVSRFKEKPTMIFHSLNSYRPQK